MKLAVCIPCHKAHVIYIPQLLESIDQQTHLPTIVSISISQWTDPPPVFQCKVPVEVNCTSDILPAANNRNVAANTVLDRVDSLSFIDADDIMHPRRIEFIINGLSQYDVVYHSYQLWETNTQFPLVALTGAIYRGRWRVVKSNEPHLSARVQLLEKRGLLYTVAQLHLAHVSVKTEIFRKMQFPLGRGRCDDSEYLLMLYQRGCSIVAFKDRLTYFRVGASTIGLTTK